MLFNWLIFVCFYYLLYVSKCLSHVFFFRRHSVFFFYYSLPADDSHRLLGRASSVCNNYTWLRASRYRTCLADLKSKQKCPNGHIKMEMKIRVR